MTVDPKTRMLVFGWMLAFAVALLLDQRVADGVAGHARDVKFSPIVRVIKLPGWYPFTLIVAAAVALFHSRRWTGAGLIAGSAGRRGQALKQRFSGNGARALNGFAVDHGDRAHAGDLHLLQVDAAAGHFDLLR